MNLDRASAVFRALGHPVRLGIVQRLDAEHEICACDFTEHFGISQPTISGHLRTLREAGIVRTRRNGNQICYSLRPEVLEEIAVVVQSLHRADGVRA